jgi:hypothetical protein
MNKVTLVASNICSALNLESAIGSRVTDAVEFFRTVTPIIGAHDFTGGPVPGQAVLQVPEAVPFVSAGVGPRSPRPEDYVLREHRGRVDAYLKREFAAKATSCAVVVYTRDAYFRDPDISPAEATRIDAANPTHILVALLASTSPTTSPLSPYRFVWNLAGGNREAETWTAKEIRTKALTILAYDKEWAPVAD